MMCWRRCHARGSATADQARGARRLARTATTAPITMAASATLNTGHHWRSMKSTTAPWRKPSSPRNARSARLPSAPPATRPAATAPAGRRAGRRQQEQDDHHEGEQGDQRTEVLAPADAERGAGVVGEVEAERADDVDDRPTGQPVDRPPLRELVEQDRQAEGQDRDHAGEPRDGDIARRGCRSSATGDTTSRSRPCQRAAVGGRERSSPHRRPSPPVLYSTRSRAHGIASSRSFGIGSPDTSQMP